MKEKFMIEAIKQAKNAYNIDEVPVGAVIVKDNKIISKGYNKIETTNDSTNHAEIIAIKKASKKINNWRLNECELYVTLEPCDMCKGAIQNSRIKNVYYLISKENKYNIKTNFEKMCFKKYNDYLILLKKFFEEKRG